MLHRATTTGPPEMPTMSTRLDVPKAYKLYINGQFPRSESGRSLRVTSADGTRVLAHACLASKKDVRDAVAAARAAHEGWLRRVAYNRGQILYRMAEMLEGKRGEFIEAIEATREASSTAARRRTNRESLSAASELHASVDRLVTFAGWADKFSQVMGSHNAVNGPYYNFTIAEGTGVVAVIAPTEASHPGLLALVSLLAPALCAGCTVVALAGGSHTLPACILGEVCATSDVPAGVVNLLTGERDELIETIAQHRDIDAIHAGGMSAIHARILRLGAAENVKRVTVRAMEPSAWLDDARCDSPAWIEPFVEMKTIWHPSSA